MNEETTETQPKWRPLNRVQRRVAGVLVEKAKTTPDSYPMTLNALTNGCNQKSNRSPQMSVAADDIELILEELREMGAIGEVQGGGRVNKYRHYMYDWLGVEKLELAVMTELLLRGEQTLGELRARAARMDPIPDLGTLRPVVDSLIAKNLVVSLTPPGRGQVVTHNLYEPNELESLKRQHGGTGGGAASPSPQPTAAAPSPAAAPAAPAAHAPPPPPSAEANREIEDLRAEIAELRELLERLDDRVHRLET